MKVRKLLSVNDLCLPRCIG